MDGWIGLTRVPGEVRLLLQMISVHHVVASVAPSNATPTALALRHSEGSSGTENSNLLLTPPPSPRISSPPSPSKIPHTAAVVGRQQDSIPPPAGGNCVAILDTARKQALSTVHYQKLDFNQPLQPIHDVRDIYFLPDCTAKLPQNNFYAPCMKAALKNCKALHKLFSFFSGADATAAVGSSAFVERTEVFPRSTNQPAAGQSKGEGGKPTLNINPFTEATFSRTSPTSSHFFSTRGCSTLKSSHKLTDFTSIHVVSGICLFSQQHLGLKHGEHSDHCPPLPSDTKPTMYELETLLRLSSAIAGTVSLLPVSVLPTTTVILDIPRIQYYAPILAAFSSGYCTRRHMEAWLEKIDTRHDQLAQAFTAAVKTALLSNGIHNIRVEISTCLDVLLPHIRSQLTSSIPLQITALLHELTHADPAWSSYLPAPPPIDLAALSKASYSYTLLRPVLSSSQDAKPLLLHIDNPAEWRIFSEAQKMFGRRPGLLLGLYPLERVFTAESTGRSSLYLQDCGQRLQDEDKGEVNPKEVLERVYGKEKVRAVVEQVW